MGKLDNTIISTLESKTSGLTLSEIAEIVGESEKKVFKALRRLYQKGVIDSENRRYKLSDQ